jgi:hypothetical protein
LPLLGIVSFGEGFHNNHHANPGSARMGEARYELDLGWCLLRGLERVGLASELAASHRGATLRHNARRRDGSEAPLTADARHRTAVGQRLARPEGHAGAEDARATSRHRQEA